VAALVGGAVKVTSVDTSAKALEMSCEQVLLNGFAADRHRACEEDVFRYLRNEPLDASFIILDPPAFSKRRSDIVQACRGYKDINRLAIAKSPPRSFLLTSSCSHFVDEALFQKVVFQASMEAKRTVRILDRHHYAPDHPVNICHPEAHYLKSLFLYIE
jgi:23S rRNA (cytosine1962-C5)-methyltransferase